MNNYVNKNKSFDCNGNDELDQLLCLLECNSVLSESFNQQIINIIYVILTNLKQNEDWVEGEIIKLKEEMNWLSVFSDKFISVVIGQLLLGLQKQIQLNNNEKES